MKIAIIYDSVTGTTLKAGEFIKEGIAKVSGCEAACYSIDEATEEIIREADALIIGSPTYMATTTSRMLTWLQTKAPKKLFAGKLGGAFATEMYIHGGAENAISTILDVEMVFGMMVYSGGNAFGHPVIHLGPVGMSQNIEDFRDIFCLYGERFANQLALIKA